MSTQPSSTPQTPVPVPSLTPKQPKSWLARYWIWLLVGVFACGLLFVAGIVTLFLGAMRSSDVAKEAFARAQSNPLVAQRLGAPLSEGWVISGSINVSGSSGDADLTVYVTAQKATGTWTYSLMQAAIEGSGERIDLLAHLAPDQPASAPAPAPAAADVQTTPAPTDASVAMAAAPQPAAADPAAAAAAQPAAADPAPAAEPPQAKPGSGVIASAQYSNDPNLRCDVLEVKRITGGVLLARWRFVNTGSKPVGYDFSWDDIYYIDPATNKKYSNLNIDGKRILDMWWGTLPAGEQRVMWAKYPAPPPTSKRISLNVPKFTPFEDIAVSQ
jgi:hypothetical protein